MYVVTLSVFHNLAIWLLYVNKPEPDGRTGFTTAVVRPESGIKQDICGTLQFFHTSPAFNASIKENRSKFCHNILYARTRMVG